MGMGMASKVSAMADGTGRARGLASRDAGQQTSRVAVTGLATIRFMHLASGRIRGACCRVAVETQCNRRQTVGMAVIWQIRTMAGHTVPTRRRHIRSLAIGCFQRSCGGIMTGDTGIMNLGIAGIYRN